jgi:hypothetical protein
MLSAAVARTTFRPPRSYTTLRDAIRSYPAIEKATIRPASRQNRMCACLVRWRHKVTSRVAASRQPAGVAARRLRLRGARRSRARSRSSCEASADTAGHGRQERRQASGGDRPRGLVLSDRERHAARDARRGRPFPGRPPSARRTAGSRVRPDRSVALAPARPRRRRGRRPRTRSPNGRYRARAWGRSPSCRPLLRSSSSAGWPGDGRGGRRSVSARRPQPARRSALLYRRATRSGGSAAASKG